MTYNKKYKVFEDEETVNFHISRWMFYIDGGKVFFAPKKVSYSHAEWFEKIGFDNNFIDSHVRGFIDKLGDIYFCIGYDFRIDEFAEKTFLSCICEFKDKVSENSRVFGGFIRKGKFLNSQAFRQYEP